MTTSEGSGLFVGDPSAGLNPAKPGKPLDWTDDRAPSPQNLAQKPAWTDDADQEGDDPRLGPVRL